MFALTHHHRNGIKESNLIICWKEELPITISTGYNQAKAEMNRKMNHENIFSPPLLSASAEPLVREKEGRIDTAFVPLNVEVCPTTL